MSLDNLSVQDFLTALNINYDKYIEEAPALQQFPCDNRAALIAPPGAGKTVTVAGLFARAIAKVRETEDTDHPFYCRILERGSNIHQDVSDLADGIFPAKTQQYLGFRSSPGLLLEQKKVLNFGKLIGAKSGGVTLWHKMLQLPICDLPGETLTQVMWQVRAQTGAKAQLVRASIESAIADMRESDAYIFIIKGSTAKGLGVQLESEKDLTLSRDPDVNMVRMLEDLATYKANRGRKIKAAYVVITAWDKLKKLGNRLGFDLLDPYLGKQTIKDFVSSCFPQFYAALVSCRIPVVEYYPMFFQTEKDDANEEVLFEDPVEIRQPDGSITVKIVKRPHIIRRDLFDPGATLWQNVRKISHSELQYDRLLNDIMKLAVSS